MMLSSRTGTAVSRVVTRHYSRSVVQKAEPKMHNATGTWDALKSKRPVDPDDLHVSAVAVVARVRICEIPNSVG
jgi:hypothetical protein